MTAALGAFVRAARAARGSLRKLGPQLGLSISSLSRIENGHRDAVGPDALARVFDRLGLDRWEGFRLAEMADPDLTAMVHLPCRALVELLRTGAGDDDWGAALEAVKLARARRAGGS